MRLALAALLAALVAACVGTAGSALAQVRTTEQGEVRHVYDDAEPEWEAPADATVTLHAPDDLTVCRQGRIGLSAGIQIAHMGCWRRTSDTEPPRLAVPSGPAYLGVRRGLDVEWIGGGAITLGDGDVVTVRIEDRLWVRVLGWSVFGAALVTALVSGIGIGLRAWHEDLGPILALSVGAVLVFVGIAFAFFGDGIEVTHTAPAAPPD